MLPLVDRLLSPREAATVLGICRATVYALCADGQLPHFRVRNQIRIPESALHDYLKGGQPQ